MYFQFEQLLIIPVVSLLVTLNKYTALGVLSFSMYHFCVSKYSQSMRTFEKKQTKNKGRKENHRRKTDYFIAKYATS